MQSTDTTVYLLQLPISQFKAIKKAARVLVNAGMSTDAAIDLLVETHRQKFQHVYRRVS